MTLTPENRVRVRIDAALVAAGWFIQNCEEINLTAGRGAAIREFFLKPGYGYTDYILFVDGNAVGVLEAKKEGETLPGVEPEGARDIQGLSDNIRIPCCPFMARSESHGPERYFVDSLDPRPHRRRVFAAQPPGALAESLEAGLWNVGVDVACAHMAAGATKFQKPHSYLSADPSWLRGVSSC